MGNNSVTMENAEIRSEARSILQGNWGLGVAIILVVSLLGGLGGSSGTFWNVSGRADAQSVLTIAAIIFGFLSVLYSILVANVITYGFSISYLKMGREGRLSFENLFEGFKDYGRVVGMMFLKNLFISLWTLLFVIPGIIKGYSYSMADYILMDNPQMGSLSAITKSKEMMKGWKAKLFLLDLSLIGWWFLCLLTCGIGYLWLGSYYKTNHIVFYMELKGEDKTEILANAYTVEATPEELEKMEKAQEEIERLNKEQQEKGL